MTDASQTPAFEALGVGPATGWGRRSAGRPMRTIERVGRGWMIGLALGLALALAPPGAAQEVVAAPLDLFGAHFGAARQPSRAPVWWTGVSILSLTQFDGRWTSPTSGQFIQYGDLATTVGYIYATGGLTALFETALPWPATMSASLHLGGTNDGPPLAVQSAIHDLLGVPHVFREHRSDTTVLAGVDGEVLVWPTSWIALGASGSFGTFHRELGARLHLLDLPISCTGLIGSLSAGGAWLYGTGGLRPERVAPHVRSTGYASASGMLYHPRIGGLQLAWTSNLYDERPELLLGIFLDAPLSDRFRFRAEFVNDLLLDKDRGPTGGGRTFLTATR